jgi:hypothetical protein
MPRVPFAWNAYKHRTLPASAQRLINVFAEKQPPGSKSEMLLLPTPGMELFVTVGDGPTRGFTEMAGELIVVSGTSVYRVDTVPGAVFLGTVDDGGPVTMAENGTQCLIVVPETGRGFVVTTSGVTQVTDVDFPMASSVTYLDGYFIVSERNSNAFHLSALDDATTWNGDTAEAERSPDNLERVIRAGSVLWLVGDKTSEIWSNVGSSDFPFAQVSGAFIERGTAARDSVAQRLGTVFWLGDDRCFYRSDNFQPTRISNHAIEQELAGYTRVDDARASVYEQEGHIFWVVSFPSAFDDRGATWVYDAKENFWHERASEGRAVYRCGALGSFAGAAIGGDATDGRIYTINPNLSTEAGTTVIRSATGVTFHAENKRVFFSRFSAEFERGASAYASTAPAAVTGDVWLTASSDGGRTWGAERWRSLGYQGEYRGRVEWLRLGSAREKVFRLQWSDDVRTALIAVNVDAEAGAH